jgi:hypothetical protein
MSDLNNINSDNQYKKDVNNYCECNNNLNENFIYNCNCKKFYGFGVGIGSYTTDYNSITTATSTATATSNLSQKDADKVAEKIAIEVAQSNAETIADVINQTVVVLKQNGICAIGPTGNFSGLLNQSIIPDEDNVYDLGSFNKEFKHLYLGSNSIFIDGIPINSNNKVITLESGTLIDNVNVENLTIKGCLNNVQELENITTALIGDSYIIGQNIWSCIVNNPTTLNEWVDIGLIKGPMGLLGPQGNIGNTGPQGNMGVIGPQGLTGYTGSKGITGFKGVKGSIGFIGYTGYTGYTGYRGNQGNTGYTGNIGYTGYTGPQGSIGISCPISDIYGASESLSNLSFINLENNKVHELLPI